MQDLGDSTANSSCSISSDCSSQDTFIDMDVIKGGTDTANREMGGIQQIPNFSSQNIRE